MFRWFSRVRAQKPTDPGHLSTVIAGTGFSQRVAGYVDDFNSVYDLSKRYMGSADVNAANEEHVVRSATEQVVGYVGHVSEAINGGHWHKVYDSAHNLIGLVDNASEITTPSDQTLGGVNYNEVGNGPGWLRAGAALLLLLRA